MYDTPQLIEFARDRDGEIRASAMRCLLDRAARGQENITLAIPLLIDALQDPRRGIRSKAAQALWRMAEHELDIHAAVPALLQMIGSEESRSRHRNDLPVVFCVKAICQHALSRENWETVEALLETAPFFIRADVSEWIRLLDFSDRRTSHLLPVLLKLATDADVLIRQEACDSIHLFRLELSGFSVPVLLELENKVESLCAEHPKKHAFSSIQSIHLRHAASMVLEGIARQKARKARSEDGKLLAGETLPRPAGRCTLYRTTQKAIR